MSVGDRGGDSAAHPERAVERAAEDDWALVASVRLAALIDSPGSFGSTFAHERGYGEDAWRSWCRDTATFLALQHGTPVGMAAGVAGTSPDQRRLVALWVHPNHRGSGAATALVTAVRTWARRDGATALTLWVTRGNHAAENLYRRAGFTPTGAVKALPSNPGLVEVELSLSLG